MNYFYKERIQKQSSSNNQRFKCISDGLLEQIILKYGKFQLENRCPAFVV